MVLKYDWDETIDRMDPKYVTLDVEHDANIETRIPGNGASLGVSIVGREIGSNEFIGHYYPFRHFDVNVPSATGEKLRDFINNKVQNLIMYNAKNDLVTAADLGIYYNGNFYDPMLMEHWLYGKYFNMSLDTISRLRGGNPKDMPPEMRMIIDAPGKNKGWANVPYFMMKMYGVNDSLITHELFLKLLPPFRRHESRWLEMQEFIRYIIRMERAGIRLNKKLCEDQMEYGIDVMEQIQFELELNPASPTDMYELFVKKLKLGVKKKTPGGKPSFDKSALAEYDIELASTNSPVAKMVKEFRGWQKTISSNYKPYLELLGPDGRLRPKFNFHITPTTRLSAEKPALQQIPRLSPQEWNGNLRNAFIAAPGFTLWDVDYSQLELRILSHYAQDQHLMAILNDPLRSLFKEMSARLRWDYDKTKTFVYSVSYGAEVNRIREIFGVDAFTARSMKDQFMVHTYPKIGKLFNECKEKWRERGYVILWTGHEVKNRVDDKPHAAMNYLAQGGGAEIVKKNIIQLGRTIDWLDCRMVLQVHDSVVFEIRNGTEGYWLPIIKEIMQRQPHPNFKVRFPVAIKKWGTKDEITV